MLSVAITSAEFSIGLLVCEFPFESKSTDNWDCTLSSLYVNWTDENGKRITRSYKFYGFLFFVTTMTSLLHCIPQVVFNSVAESYADNLANSLTNKVIISCQNSQNIDIFRCIFLKVLPDCEDEKKRIKSFYKVLASNAKKHRRIFTMYVIAKILCLATLLANVIIIDHILDGNYLTYGLNYFNGPTFKGLYKENSTFAEFIIPHKVQCALTRGFSGGQTEKHTGQCIIIFSALIQIVLLAKWFVYASIMIIDIGSLLTMALLLSIPKLRP